MLVDIYSFLTASHALPIVVAIAIGSAVYAFVLDTTLLRGFAISILVILISIAIILLLIGVFGLFSSLYGSFG
jgi:hypothetical protein